MTEYLSPGPLRWLIRLGAGALGLLFFACAVVAVVAAVAEWKTGGVVGALGPLVFALGAVPVGGFLLRLGIYGRDPREDDDH